MLALGGLVAVLALALAACGSSSKSESKEGSTKSASSISLGMVYATTTQNAFQEMALGAEAAAAHEGVKLSASAPNGINPPQEITQFEAYTRTTKDGIVADTIGSEAFTRAWARATGEGIPVIALDASPAEGSGVTTFIGNDNYALGESIIKYLLPKLPKTGEVVIGNDIPGLALLTQRDEGMIVLLKKERPGLKISGPYDTGSEPTENYDHWVNLVKAHPHAVAYLGPGDQDAVSFQKIEKSQGIKFINGACDLDPTALEAVKNGYVDVLADPHHYLKGYIAASLLAQHAKTGKKIPEGWWNPGQGLVTPSDIKEIIHRESSDKARDEFFEPIAQEELKDPSKYIKPLSEANKKP